MIFKLFKNYQKNKELKSVIKWIQRFEQNNSNQREIKSFKIWIVANKLKI